MFSLSSKIVNGICFEQLSENKITPHLSFFHSIELILKEFIFSGICRFIPLSVDPSFILIMGIQLKP